MDFYERYEYLCKKRGIDPCSDKTAELIGVKKGTISSWKVKGTIPRATAVAAIADAFHISADYLLGRTDDPSDFAGFDSDYAKLDASDRAKIDGFLQGLLASDKYKKQSQHLA